MQESEAIVWTEETIREVGDYLEAHERERMKRGLVNLSECETRVTEIHAWVRNKLQNLNN